MPGNRFARMMYGWHPNKAIESRLGIKIFCICLIKEVENIRAKETTYQGNRTPVPGMVSFFYALILIK